MLREEYEKVARDIFSGEALDIVLAQIQNYYSLSKLKFIKKPKYKIGEDVILDKGNYLHGFGSSLNYLEQISHEGKISKEFAGLDGGHGVSYVASTWKINDKIKLKDYVINYSGMTVTYGDEYEIVPYGKLDDFVEKMKGVKHFLWRAESTMEIRFMPSLAKNENQFALIFDLSHKECENLLKNDILNPDIPDEIRFAGSSQPSKRAVDNKHHSDDKQNERIAYIIFGIPANLIEGILVGRIYEKDDKILDKIHKLFPNSYVCNLDGKVI